MIGDMNMVNHVVIVGNGQLCKEFLEEIQCGDFTIGVDRAAFWLLERGVIPDVAIGDFDSVTKQEFHRIKKEVINVKKFSPKKDFTDMELAIDEALLLSPDEIVIFGAIGTRMDHTLINIYLLKKVLQKNIPMIIKDTNNEIRLVSDSVILENDPIYRYVSIIPVTDEVVITLNGFKYNVRKKIISRGESIGVSNEFASKHASIHVHKGAVCVIRSRD